MDRHTAKLLQAGLGVTMGLKALEVAQALYPQEEADPGLLVGASASDEDSNVNVPSQKVPASIQSMAVTQGQLRGTLRHSPPHRQFLIHRCSHCFTAVALLGDFSMVTQPHLVQALHSSVG